VRVDDMASNICQALPSRESSPLIGRNRGAARGAWQCSTTQGRLHIGFAASWDAI